VTRGGCPANTIAQVTIDAQGLASRYECASWRREIYRRLIAQYHPNLIYVETRSQVWAIRKNGHNYGPGTAEHRKLWSQGWDPTLRALTAGPGKVIVAKITPTMPFHVPACLSTHTEGTKACDARLSPKSLEVRYNRIIAGLPKRYPGVTVVDPTPIICPHRKCPAMLHGQIVHRDTNHISASYSRTVAKHWEAMLVRAGVRFP
jgi:hypothetical protein